MPNEKGSNEPPTETKGESSAAAPVAPATPQQGEIGKERNEYTAGEQGRAKELAREFRTVEIIQIVINGLLGVIGVFALLIYYGQLRQMRKATEKAGISADAAKKAADLAAGNADVAKQSFRLDQRAWLAVAAANNTFRDGEPVYTPVRVMNNGKTPARKVTGDFILRLLKPSQAPEFIYEHRYRLHLPTVTVMPNAPLDFSVYAVSGPREISSASPKPAPPLLATPEMRKEIESGKLVVVLHGRLTYEDVFGISHWVHFCTLGGAQAIGGASFTTAVAAGCDEYNDTDNN